MQLFLSILSALLQSWASLPAAERSALKDSIKGLFDADSVDVPELLRRLEAAPLLDGSEARAAINELRSVFSLPALIGENRDVQDGKPPPTDAEASTSRPGVEGAETPVAGRPVLPTDNEGEA